MFTNNVCGAYQECHAQYFDIKKAYVKAGNNIEDVNRFEREAIEHDLNYAFSKSQLWNQDMCIYAKYLQEATLHALSTFLIVLISEKVIWEGYQIILKHLNSSRKFDLYRTFMQRHIELDTDEHGPATVQWVNYYLDNSAVTESELAKAIDVVIKFIELRINTYHL